MNRILIFIVLGALLYALYKYQSQIMGLTFGQKYYDNNHIPIQNNQDSKITKNKKNKKQKKVQFQDVLSNDDVSTDEISQISLGSLEDVKAFDISKVTPNKDAESLGNMSDMTDIMTNDESSFFF